MDESSLGRLLPSDLFPGSTVTRQVATCPLRSAQTSQTTRNFSEQQRNRGEPRAHPQVQLGPRSSQVPLQTTRAYRAQELADKTRKGFSYLHRWRTLTKKQLAAKRRITELNANAELRYMNITQDNVSAWPTLSDLHDYLKAFDDFFFFGALKDWIRLDLQHDDIPCCGVIAVGLTRSDAGPPGTLITITDRHALWQEPAYRYNEILGTLLHEMVHALFSVYSCNCAQCLVDEAVVASVGLTGHGPVWQSLAARVEEAVVAHWPNLQYFVNRGCINLQGSRKIEQDSIQQRQGHNAPSPEREPPREDEPVAWRTRNHPRLRRM
ncbi:MAG: hypothetical protein LQ347_002359 [Umbilicaria vellea]|nr:MAG: hypothetical protein LQ347_002359 [Umbilicaria vellea]